MNRDHHPEEDQRHRQIAQLPVHSRDGIGRHRGQDQYQDDGSRRDPHAIHEVAHDVAVR
ncbi:hypothetical protein D3C74_334140 [compost metagenome]